MGFSAEAKTIKELVYGFSYSDQYADQLAKLASGNGAVRFSVRRAIDLQNMNADTLHRSLRRRIFGRRHCFQ
jgi:hypothetical protein